jgi:hypothetical protein
MTNEKSQRHSSFVIRSFVVRHFATGGCHAHVAAAVCRGELRVWANSQGPAIVAPTLEEAIAARTPRLAL